MKGWNLILLAASFWALPTHKGTHSLLWLGHNYTISNGRYQVYNYDNNRDQRRPTYTYLKYIWSNVFFCIQCISLFNKKRINLNSIRDIKKQAVNLYYLIHQSFNNSSLEASRKKIKKISSCTQKVNKERVIKNIYWMPSWLWECNNYNDKFNTLLRLCENTELFYLYTNVCS